MQLDPSISASVNRSAEVSRTPTTRGLAQAGSIVPISQADHPGKSENHRPLHDDPKHAGSEGRRREEGPARRRDSIELRIGSGGELSDTERRIVEKLQARDRAVRARAEAQRTAAGQIYRGGPVYQYTTGPDGKQYAVDAEVQIESGAGRTPAETIERAELAARTALAAPAPTDADRRAAARAQVMAAEAQRAKALEQVENPGGNEQRTRGVDVRG